MDILRFILHGSVQYLMMVHSGAHTPPMKSETELASACSRPNLTAPCVLLSPRAIVLRATQIKVGMAMAYPRTRAVRILAIFLLTSMVGKSPGPYAQIKDDTLPAN